jgi:hypothetical protein
MTVFVTRRSIAAPPERVWPVLADVLRWPEWTTSVERVEPLGDPVLATGARFRVFQPRLRPAVFTVTSCEPPWGFTWTMSGAGVRAVADHVLEPAGPGCTLLLRLEYAGLLGGLVGLLARSLTEDYMNREASGLKRRCESGA